MTTTGRIREHVVSTDWEVGTIVDALGPYSTLVEEGRYGIDADDRRTIEAEGPIIGYLAIRLPRKMPHIALDARRTWDITVVYLDRQPLKAHRYTLDGEFDRHFKAYVPPGYEFDAFLVLSPALMALLIDEAGALDVEIRDDLLVVYCPGGFALTDPREWENLARIVETVGAVSWRQARGYSGIRARERGAVTNAGAAIAVVPRLSPRWMTVGVLGALAVLLAVASCGVRVLMTQQGPRGHARGPRSDRPGALGVQRWRA